MLRLALVLAVLAVAPLAHAALEVHVDGLGSEEHDNVRAQLGLAAYEKRLDGKPPQAQEVERLYAQAEGEIRRALQPFGWYTPSIHETLAHEGDDWTARFEVDAGPETRVTAVDIALTGPGAKLPELVAAARRRWPLQLDARLKQTAYATVKDRLLAAAGAAGYLQAHYTRHELRVDPATHSAQVFLTLDTGPRFYFGAISIEQQTPRLKEAFVRRYLKFHQGQPFAASEVLATQFALNDLGYFQSVEVDAQRSHANAEHQIPVVISLRYAKPFVYRFGVGYGTDTGARALAGMTWRRVNDLGHTFSFDLRPAQKISSAVARYGIPFGGLPGQQYEVKAQALDQNFEGIDERLYSIGGARIQLRGLWQRRYYLDLVSDDYTIGSEPSRHSMLLTPGVSLSRTDLNNPVFPTRGWAISMDLHGATRHDGLSSTDFLAVHFKVRGVFPLGWRWRVLARAEEGAIATSDFDALPPSQRFFAGGNGSVRGYAYRSLAPTNRFGRIAGGKYLTTGSLELDWDVHPPFGVAAFVDAGGADDSPNVRLHVGAGLGVLYHAPFGSLVLDLAHPFDRGLSPVRVDVAVRVGL